MASGMSQLFLTATDESQIAVLCSSDGNILDIKKAVAEKRGVPIEKLDIIYAGAIQKDDIPIKPFLGQTTVRLLIKK